MRVGIIVDGQSEVSALPKLKPQLEQASGNTIIGPIRAQIHPKASVVVIARVAVESIAILRAQRGAEKIVVLIDREDRQACPGDFAKRVLERILPSVAIPVDIVIKDRKFENWLVADVDAMLDMSARFSLSRGAVNSIRPNKADNTDAEALIRAAAIRGSYHKVKDAGRILGQADVSNMATNSRSFRKFLRCVGHPAYATQSRAPVDVGP